MLQVIGIYSKHSGTFNYKEFKQIEEHFRPANGLIYLTSFDSVKKYKEEISLEEAIAKVVEEEPSYIYLRAGDGGAMLTISDLLNQKQVQKKESLWKPKIILDPAGTHNKVYREYGILSLYAFGKRSKLQRHDYLQSILEDLEREKELKTVPLKLIKVALDNQIFYTSDFGAGLPTEAILKYLGANKEQITREKSQNLKFKKPKPLDIFTVSLEILFKITTGENVFKGTKVKLYADGKPLTKEGYQPFIGFLFSTDELTIPGFKTMYDAKRYRGQGHFIATWKHEVEVLPYLGHLAFGWPLGENTIDLKVKKLYGKFEEEEVVQFSGEFAKTKEFTAEVSQDEVELVIPHYFQRLYADNLVYELTRMAATNLIYPLLRFYYEGKGEREIDLYRLYLEQLLLPQKIRENISKIKRLI
ncbi:hypothetical protein HZC32_01970 [Candidatus Woesearchaeota archaeon]|nr:hypothetical protein [Candidatus Woesearchaeota archaeon]